MKENIGFVRVGAATPVLELADPLTNAGNIITVIRRAAEDKAGFLLFPELCLTGRSCGDLFLQDRLYEAQLEALGHIVRSTTDIGTVVILGMMLRTDNTAYNCAAVIQGGVIRGIVPKMYPPLPENSAAEGMFTPGSAAPAGSDCVRLFGRTVPFGRMTFEDERGELKIGVEVGDDMQRPVTPAAGLIASGADIIFNTGAAVETAGSSAARKRMIENFTSVARCGYVFASPGAGESVADGLCSGHCIIAERGRTLIESTKYEFENHITYSEIDFRGIGYARSKAGSPGAAQGAPGPAPVKVALGPVPVISESDDLLRVISKQPFIPDDKDELRERCSEIFDIQSNALARRIMHTGAKKTVLGISGGLDSTLSLLVCSNAHKILGRPASDIIAVTMPGFGTTDQTYRNALTLMRVLGADVREISIAGSVWQHFIDIGHDENVRNVTYENAQARERTQILMDIANDEEGFVVGTGDLSESALGWCTFNGDHMAMYNVNCDIPKTLIRKVVEGVMENDSQDRLLSETLGKILDTPISPELLPPDEGGNIAQKTEDKVGAYELHDFFIYHTIKDGTDPETLYYLARQAFRGEFDDSYILGCLKTFYSRFFSQQFKRNCVPDGPKIGGICLSPRGAWVMPSDAGAAAWLEALDKD